MLIGDIKLTDNRTAVLSCKLPEKSVLRAVLLDSTSRARWEHQITLDNTARSLEFELPRLGKGLYHLWITVNDQTFIREVNVSRSLLGSLFHRMLGFLN